jgi:TRAP-type C4-dicarboxylate transport system substrate-binding protein
MRLFVFLMALMLAACERAEPSGVTELVYASPYSPSHPFSQADQDWMSFVERESGGRIRIHPIWSGALLSSDQSMEELRHDVADVGLITPIYTKGGAHLIRIQSGFYSGAKTFESQVALYNCMADNDPEFTRELKGLQVLAVQGGSLPGIITKNVPVRDLDDLKGLRMRAPTELLNVLWDLGVDPVNMPMGDVYSALAKDIIDGVIAPADTFKSLHFAEVSRYFYLLEIPRGAYPARAMSRKKWDSLTETDRQILKRGVGVWEKALAHQTEKAVEEGVELAKDSGIEFHDATPEDQGKFNELYLREARRNAASLKRYGIDGMSAFETARASIRPDGTITCKDPSL